MTLVEGGASLAEQVRSAPRVALYLDYDGTLAPIVPHPRDAQLPVPVRHALMALAADPRFTISIVSGRELADLEGRVAIPHLIYAGNHGIEIRGRGMEFTAQAALESEARLRLVISDLRASLDKIAGAQVEDKVLTASVHYRQVDSAHWSAVERMVRTRVQNETAFLIRSGKMVLEIRPRVNWNKGSAVLWIREQLGLAGALEVYIGDDTTDEDAFAALPEALTIRVGPLAPTAARYSFSDTPEVERFLQRLSAQKEPPL